MQGYASVNGLQMYYEIHGEEQPLVFLQGAFSAIGSSSGKVLPSLAKTHRVIAFELQAHGRTLLIIGDSDLVRPGHAVKMFRLLGGGVFGDTPAGLPNSQLAILPGTSHVSLVDRADWIVSMVDEFLDAPVNYR